VLCLIVLIDSSEGKQQVPAASLLSVQIPIIIPKMSSGSPSPSAGVSSTSVLLVSAVAGFLFLTVQGLAHGQSIYIAASAAVGLLLTLWRAFRNAREDGDSSGGSSVTLAAQIQCGYKSLHVTSTTHTIKKSICGVGSGDGGHGISSSSSHSNSTTNRAASAAWGATLTASGHGLQLLPAPGTASWQQQQQQQQQLQQQQALGFW
jgi:hypothetical protein